MNLGLRLKSRYSPGRWQRLGEKQDLLVTSAASSKQPQNRTLWAYRPSENEWEELEIAGEDVPRRMGWNHALVYDARRDLILLVAGAGGDTGTASVYALRFKDR